MRLSAWGKTDRDTGSSHHLAHHLMDVAAVFQHLLGLPAFRDRAEKAAGGSLSERTLARLGVIVFLHDIGKLHPGFQANGSPARAGIDRILQGGYFFWTRFPRVCRDRPQRGSDGILRTVLPPSPRAEYLGRRVRPGDWRRRVPGGCCGSGKRRRPGRGIARGLSARGPEVRVAAAPSDTCGSPARAGIDLLREAPHQRRVLPWRDSCSASLTVTASDNYYYRE